MSDYEKKFVMPQKEKELKENEKIMKELDLAERAKWERLA
jgi:hypothetical protein